MRDWFLTQDDPLALRLAADVRLGQTDYGDDQSWELTLAGGEPPALALRTTYGLRARDMRLFPIFSEGDRTINDPAEFVFTPAVRAFYPNYLRVTFEPLDAIAVTAHYWVPDSHAVAGQLALINHDPSEQTRRVRLSLAALLKPLENPQILSPGQADGLALLQGHSGNLEIVVAMEGDAIADSSPYPTLTCTLDMPPNEPVYVRWAQAARPTAGASLALIREVLAREWDGEFARIELTNAAGLEIETGDRDWDAAFAFAQVVALRSFLGATAHLPHPSFVFTRQPDRGYSRKGDGSDHMWQWDGQVATEAYVTLPQIAPSAPELAKGVLRNWLAVQEETGFIDWKPGLGGQRNRALCLPLLASLAWTLYEYTEDRTFVEEVYPGLRRFFEAWFAPRFDRDEDGVPEWSHTVQSAFDDNPSFVRWRAWAQGADITAAESPDLAAYLYREARSLRRMAELLGQPPDHVLDLRAQRLRSAVEMMWRDDTATYHYVDRDTHEVTRGEVLHTSRGNLALDVNRRFAPAARLMVKVIGPRDARPAMTVTLSGRGRRGRHRVETLKRSAVQWYFGVGTAVSDKAYIEVERVEVAGLSDEFEVTVSVVDYARQDQTLLLPLWAGLPDVARAEALVRQTVLDPERYWRAYGLPNCSALDPAYKADNREGSGGVWLMWNTMLGEGLIDYGYRAEAAQLVTRLMTAMVHSLRTEKSFREAYNADKLEGLGDRDYLWGVAPVHLFLRTVGLRLISPRRVFIEGRNPFPWPVTVRWKGVSVVKDSASTVITFPSGRSVTIEGDQAQFVDDQ
jgi:hypothetical protein